MVRFQSRSNSAFQLNSLLIEQNNYSEATFGSLNNIYLEFTFKLSNAAVIKWKSNFLSQVALFLRLIGLGKAGKTGNRWNIGETENT